MRSKTCSSPTFVTRPPRLSFELIASLRHRSERERHGLFFIDGFRFVTAALEGGAEISGLVQSASILRNGPLPEPIQALLSSGLPVLDLPPRAFRELALAPEPQGIGVLVRLRWEPLAGQVPKPSACWLAVEQVRNPGNMGTILRSAEAAGATGLIVLDRSLDGTDHALDPHDPLVVRASMGAVFGLRFVRTTYREFRQWNRERAFTIIGAAPEAAADYRTISYRRPVVLMLGSERKGLSPGQAKLCDTVVRIPMCGRGTSLNLAVATTVLLYEIYGQRHRPP